MEVAGLVEAIDLALADRLEPGLAWSVYAHERCGTRATQTGL